MVVALLLTGVALFGMAAGKERRMLGTHLRRGAPWYLLCGAANGVVNLLVMVLAKEMTASAMFPVISAGGIVMTFLVSVCIYKERLSVWQLIGVLLGAGSVVFLSL